MKSQVIGWALAYQGVGLPKFKSEVGSHTLGDKTFFIGCSNANLDP
jgi:hypothetical protein